MATNQNTRGYALPCGRDLETMWERRAGPADAHESACPHCRSARDGLQVLHDLTGELATEDIEPPFDLTSRIMSAVRAEAGSGRHGGATEE